MLFEHKFTSVVGLVVTLNPSFLRTSKLWYCLADSGGV